MREIKFRAWDEKNKEMIDITDEIYAMNIMADSSILLSRKGFPTNKRYVLQQYTGLKDKNGKEIYEGDITSNDWQILFEDGMFIPYYDFGRQERFEDVGTDWWSNCEIIGNIYEHSDLLKQ